MAKRKHLRREKLQGDLHEIARAERKSDIVTEYISYLVFSLSGAGMVRQAMTCRNDDAQYTSGSTWNMQWVGMTVDQFRAKFEAIGFTVVDHDIPIRMNYDKNAPVTREAQQPSRDDLELQVQVLTRKLEGETFGAIGESLSLPIKDIHRAYRKALK